jgi:hypothetical protein
MERNVKTYNKLQTLPLGSIKAKGWVREQLLRNKDGMGGHLDELEPNMIATPYINCVTDEKWGAVKAGWGAEISGNYWYGLIQLAFTLDDDFLKKKAEKWVNGVMANQRENGYMGTYTENDDMFDDYNAWGTHCGMKAMLAYYEATGREDVLEAVHRCLLWFCDNWKGDRKTRYAGCTLIESMSICYSYTGDDRLLKFIHEYIDFLNRNDLYLNSMNAMLSPDLVYYSHHAAGYAVTLPIYALAYMVSGNKQYLEASISGYRKASEKVVQRTGGLTCYAEYLAPISSSVETEYCAFAFFNNSLIHLSAIVGDPRYADGVERIVFNGAQGARKKDEKAIAYMTSPNQIFANSTSGYLVADMQQYAPCYPTSCCPVTSVWVIPDYVRGMGLTDDAGNLYIASYGPAEINFGTLRLTSETQYPFRDKINFTVYTDSDIDTAINFRIPLWCENAKISVNGICLNEDLKPGSYFEIKRTWKNGDVIDIHFPMKVSIVRVDDSDSYSGYPIAIEYGPLLFSLPIPEVWEAVEGRPRTPLPEGWSWWDVNPEIKYDPSGDKYEQMGLRKYNISWNVAIDEKISPEDIQIEFTDGGYVWENPQIKLKVPGYKALFSYPPYPKKTIDPPSPIEVQDKVSLELVPYGCTNLRITYFPRAKV